MDVVLQFCDDYVFTPFIYPASWPVDNAWRQLLSLNLIADIGGILLYLIIGSISYFFVFDRRLLRHPLILEVHLSFNLQMSTPTIYCIILRKIAPLHNSATYMWSLVNLRAFATFLITHEIYGILQLFVQKCFNFVIQKIANSEIFWRRVANIGTVSTKIWSYEYCCNYFCNNFSWACRIFCRILPHLPEVLSEDTIVTELKWQLVVCWTRSISEYLCFCF